VEALRPLAPSSAVRLSDHHPTAHGGLLRLHAGRRLFLRGGLALGVAATAAGAAPLPSMRQMGEPFSTYGKPSPYEKNTIRYVTANRVVAGNGASWTPLQHLEGIITPTGLHFERHHNGVPHIDPASHRLSIHGKVKQALQFDIDSLMRYPMRSVLTFIECGGNSNSGWNERPRQAPLGNLHGLVSCGEWTGVPLSILLHECGVLPESTWIVAEGADAIAMHMSLPLKKAMDDCLVALYFNGEKLRPEHGYPLRLIAPGYEGVLNVKWLHRIELTDQPAMSRNETAKYTELMPSGKARQFTFTMDAKSVITSPSPGLGLEGAGVYEIKGLAWSGHGKIREVEVSADNGATWARAALDGPVLPRCFTRFRLPWHWDGKAATLKSRATDETGTVQPARDALVRERGRHGYFHYNAIVAWGIDTEGTVSHVF
jgi:sulfane dehydrogenase subunit SoxC